MSRRMFVQTIATLAMAFAFVVELHAQTTVPANKVFRFVPHANLAVLDPIWTTAYVTRNHGYLVYDTLFAKDAQLRIQPQMVDKWTVSDDKLTWTFTLRDGLEFHDGKPVTTEDVTFVNRWLLDNPPYKATTAVTSGSLSVTPGYFIEYMGSAPNWPGCDRENPIQAGCLGPRYRVTARATADGRAEVLLQSSYTSPE